MFQAKFICGMKSYSILISEN